ncbi:MAG: hypothetical protein AAGB15_00220 [Pseudomonadota bacterium]
MPASFVLMGISDDGANSQRLHSAHFDFNDALLPVGAAFKAALVRDRLPMRGDGQ